METLILPTITHNDIRENLIGRIQSGEWALGSRIPAETELAKEYGCARATMNRALQGLANEGLIIRKRKGGTHVSSHPVRQAKVSIPIIREQIEAIGQRYSHRLVLLEPKPAPSIIQSQLQLDANTQAVFMETVHMAGSQPFALERRWVSLQSVPDILNAPLEDISANEWLVKTVPFSNGDVTFTAHALDASDADLFGVSEGAASFTIDRTTWIGQQFITTMTLHYWPGYRLQTSL